METDPKKLREPRLKQPHVTSEEFWQQFKKVGEDASRYAQMEKQKHSETGRVRED